MVCLSALLVLIACAAVPTPAAEGNPQRPIDFLIVAVGDSTTLGRPDAANTIKQASNASTLTFMSATRALNDTLGGGVNGADWAARTTRDEAALSYPNLLRHRLEGVGADVAFVGPFTHEQQPPYVLPVRSAASAGTAAVRTLRVADLNGPVGAYVTTKTTPNITLVLLGTNDLGAAMLHKKAHDGVVDGVAVQLAQFVRSVVQSSPNARVIVSKLLPTLHPHKHLVQHFNGKLIRTVRAVLTQEEATRVRVANAGARIDPDADLYDGLNPNEAGSKKIAEEFYRHIRAWPLPARGDPNGVDNPSEIPSDRSQLDGTDGVSGWFLLTSDDGFETVQLSTMSLVVGATSTMFCLLLCTTLAAMKTKGTGVFKRRSELTLSRVQAGDGSGDIPDQILSPKSTAHPRSPPSMRAQRTRKLENISILSASSNSGSQRRLSPVLV